MARDGCLGDAERNISSAWLKLYAERNMYCMLVKFQPGAELLGRVRGTLGAPCLYRMRCGSVIVQPAAHSPSVGWVEWMPMSSDMQS
eukprot:g31009.t1